MAFDLHKNFAYSTVATAPSPATSGTSLVVASGAGALFPTPPFNAVVFPAGAQPLSTNSEIVRVTGISTDTLTIVRGATSGGGLNGEPNNQNRSIIIGDQIDAGITARSLTDIENDLYIGYKFQAYNNASQSIGNSSNTLIAFNTKVFDTGTNYSTSTNLFTAPIAAFYDLYCSVAGYGIAATAILTVYKNGSAYYQLARTGNTAAGYVGGSCTMSLAANDTIGLYAFQNAGSGQSIDAGGPGNTSFGMNFRSQT